MFPAIIGWFGLLWDLLATPVFTAYNMNISILDISIGGIITTFAISVFWKGAKA